MQAAKSFIPVFALFFVASALNGEEVQQGQSFKSSDGKFTAQYGDRDSPTDQIVIIDNKSRKISARFAVLEPLLSVAWTGDSQTVVTVGHIANGSQAEVIHLNDGAWEQHPATPREGYDFELVRQVLRKHNVELTYGIASRPTLAPESSRRFYLYTFLVDPETMEYRAKRRRDIDADNYVNLQMQTAFDWSKP